MAWKESSWYDAQTIHALAGALVLSAGLNHGWELLWLVLGFVAVTAIKEFVIDVSPFENDSWWSSADDFTFYQLGARAAGWCIANFGPVPRRARC